MRVNIDKIENLIRLPKDFATLIGIDPRGYYRYRFKYEINVDAALDSRANEVSIQLSEDTPNLRRATLFEKGNNPVQIVRSLRTQTSIQSELRRSASAKIFFAVRSDLTAVLDPSLFRDFQLNHGREGRQRGRASVREMTSSDGTRANRRRYRKIRKRREVRNASDSSKTGEVHAVVLQNKASSLDMYTQGNKRRHRTLSHTFSQRAMQNLFRSALIKGGHEPARYLGAPTNNIISVKSSMAGTISHRKPKKERKILRGKISKREGGVNENIKGFQRNFSRKASWNKRSKAKNDFRLQAQYEEKIDSIKATAGLMNTSNPASTNELPVDGLYTEEVRESVIFETIEEVINIPVGLIVAESFKLSFSVKGRGRQVGRKSRVVRHSKLLEDYSIPRVPPVFETASISKPGLALFEVEQTDENGVGVAIYKKRVPLDEPEVSGKFDLVTKIPLVPEGGRVFYSDVVDTTLPVIYRAMTYNRKNRLSGEFASVVVNGNSQAAKKRTSYSRKSAFCSLTHTIVENSIELEIRNISPGPISFSIQKRDLTTFQNKFTNVAANILVPESGKVIKRTDALIKEGRIYEYRVVLTYENGDTEIANNNLVVEYVEPDSSIVSVLISQPEIEENNKGIDVKMEITKDITNTKMDVIKGFLQEQGLDEQYADEIYKSRQDLQNLFFTRVVRQNLITGQEEEFGPLKTNSFSDYSIGRTRNVKPLEAGGQYRYAFYTYSRDPQSLFDELEKIVEKTSSSVAKKTGASFNTREYTFSPAKWHHPITLKKGNIISDKSLVRNHSKNEFTFGELVDIDYVDLDLGETQPSIDNVVAVSLDEFSNLITWEASGDITKFDHFIVSVEISGMKDIVGKCHNIDSNGKFTYVDTLNNDEEGPLVYTITPVFFDMNFGPEESAEALII